MIKHRHPGRYKSRTSKGRIVYKRRPLHKPRKKRLKRLYPYPSQRDNKEPESWQEIGVDPRTKIDLLIREKELQQERARKQREIMETQLGNLEVSGKESIKSLAKKQEEITQNLIDATQNITNEINQIHKDIKIIDDTLSVDQAEKELTSILTKRPGPKSTKEKFFDISPV